MHEFGPDHISIYTIHFSDFYFLEGVTVWLKQELPGYGIVFFFPVALKT